MFKELMYLSSLKKVKLEFHMNGIVKLYNDEKTFKVNGMIEALYILIVKF